MTTAQYIENINQRYLQGNATEHTFRGDLQQLIESLVPEIKATNEPKRQSCGAPDYILTKKDIPVGFIEAKDIGDKDLEGKNKSGNKEQFDRYKASLSNLIFTDYIDFHLYNDGQLVSQIAIAELTDKGLVPLPQNAERFENLLKDFCTQIGQNIKSSKKLAEMMAGKARLLSDVIEKALTLDIADDEATELKGQYDAFKQILIHDIEPKGFADVYAQTIAYGLFAARLHDPSIDTFSRAEAAELIPKSNPFLRKLFGYIAGADLDSRIRWIVDDLIEIFLACNVAELLKDYGKSTKMEDPIIHFYETFLAEYDPKLRKARGVWYTPQPVVDFIVRSVDEILKTEFDLPQGLADTSKVRIEVDSQTPDKKSPTGYKKLEKEVHRVQILDPATGTGTFLAEVVKHIHKKFEGQEGIWSQYVEQHLIPRLNGFELLMASYAMAHLKLDLLLTETGYTPTPNARAQRLNVYLTNSLEQANKEVPNLFMSQWLSEEGIQADYIKRDTPVMCVIGNPPYAVSSTNKGDWIQDLIADYKKDLNERKINLDDDYIKFIRYGQHYIDKNGSGILAYISNNSFIDGITHRQMRKNLLESFDKIYILDLHGNAKKKEVCPDGSKDENVFDIMQGVSINIFVKTGVKKKGELGKLYHNDLYGKRPIKYSWLNKSKVMTSNFNQLKYQPPYYFFVPKDFKLINSYDNGFQVNKLFVESRAGIESMKDSLIIHFNQESIKYLIDNIENVELLKKFAGKIRDIQIERFQNAIRNNNYEIQEVLYRPFDVRKMLYWFNDNNGVMWRNRGKVMNHVQRKANIGIGFSRTVYGNYNWQDVQVSSVMAEKGFMAMRISNAATLAPLYLYPDEENTQQTLEGEQAKRVPNLNMEIVDKIAKGMGMHFIPEEHEPGATVEVNVFTPTDLLDYIYAVLHSPSYREKYKEFLKIDFPRVPYPKDIRTFIDLQDLGSQLREIHLLESKVVEKPITKYPVSGDNLVEKPLFKCQAELVEAPSHGRVYINKEQYFEGVPEVAWNFYIGGYQPAQKWLKDRKKRTLTFEDIQHYQKIIVTLTETDRIMKEIDKIEIE